MLAPYLLRAARVLLAYLDGAFGVAGRVRPLPVGEPLSHQRHGDPSSATVPSNSNANRQTRRRATPLLVQPVPDFRRPRPSTRDVLPYRAPIRASASRPPWPAPSSPPARARPSVSRAPHEPARRPLRRRRDRPPSRRRLLPPLRAPGSRAPARHALEGVGVAQVARQYHLVMLQRLLVVALV